MKNKMVDQLNSIENKLDKLIEVVDKNIRTDVYNNLPEWNTEENLKYLKTMGYFDNQKKIND